jgi:hypothetical protein
MSTTIPNPDELRADIRARMAELRALRRLLRLAEAAEAAHQARERHHVNLATADREEVPRAN